MSVAFTVGYTHNESASAGSIQSGAAVPAVNDWSCGFVLGPGNLTSITDSVSGAIPGGQIITLGTGAGGFNNSTLYFFYEFITAATSRSFTAAFGTAGACAIVGASFSGLATSSLYDTAVQGFGTGNAAQIVTPQTGPTSSAAGVCLCLYNPDGNNAITFAAPNQITVGSNSGFAGLGNNSAGSGSGAPRYDAGYFIYTSGGLAQGTIGQTVSANEWSAGIVALSATPLSGGGGGTSTNEFVLPGRPMPSLGGMGAAGMFAQPIALGGAMYMAMPRNTAPQQNNPLGAITCHGGYDMCLVPCAGMI